MVLCQFPHCGLFLFCFYLFFSWGFGKGAAREVGVGGWGGGGGGALLIKYSVDALISDEGICQCRSIFKIKIQMK